MNEKPTIALYVRLSQEDENEGESNSVKNQRDLLTAFVKNSPELSSFKLFEFCDDGYSGVNFNRPAASRMLGKVRKGEINCIIVKDFSRFGRNYIEVGDYLEQVFPFLGVRFISVNDNYDSDCDNGSLGSIEVALRTLIYDLYSKDLSRKMKSAMQIRWKKGECISNYAIYGYKKSAENKRKLVIDEEPAAVVRRIFELAMSGKNAFEIARMLNAESVPTKSQYKKAINCTRNWDSVTANAELQYWTDGAIWKTIRDERYLGTMIGGRYARKSFGSHKMKCVPESEWIRVPNMHEAIVTPEEFALAGKMMICAPKPKFEPKKRLLYGKVRCGHCNHVLIRSGGKAPRYCCNSPRFIDSPSCISVPVSEEVIEETLLTAIRMGAKTTVSMAKAHTKKNKLIKTHCTELKKAINRHESAVNNLAQSKQDSYERYSDGKIELETFKAFKDSVNAKTEELNAKIDELKALIWESESMLSGLADVMFEWQKVMKTEKLSRDLVDTLVENIIIYDSEHIEIKWKYADECFRS